MRVEQLKSILEGCKDEWIVDVRVGIEQREQMTMNGWDSCDFELADYTAYPTGPSETHGWVTLLLGDPS